MSSRNHTIILLTALLAVLVLPSWPVSAGLIIPADTGYSGIASYGNGFHFTPFTPASELSRSYVFSGDAIIAYSHDLSQGSVGLMYGYALPGTLPKTNNLFAQAMTNYYANPPVPIANPAPSDFIVPSISNADTYYYSNPGGCGY
jgi:hypothetical protein